MATTSDKAKQLITEYNEKLQGLQNKVSDCEKAMELLQLEVRFLQEKELPEMQSRVLLDGMDASHVTKLKKRLEKFKEELQDKQEEHLILTNAIQQYKTRMGDKALEISNLYRVDLRLAEEKAISHMLFAKKQYIDSILAETEKLREVASIDTQLQYLMVAGGQKESVYPAFELSGRHQLSLSIQQVNRFIANQYTSHDYDYLKKFSDKKSL